MPRLFAGCLVLLIGAVCQADTLLFEDTFDTENGGAAALNYTNLTQWDVTAGQIDLVGNGSFDVYPGNGMYLDLDGSPGQGRIESKTVFNLLPGLYRLSFDLGNYAANANTVRVMLADVFSEDFAEGAVTTPLLTFTRVFTIGSPTSGELSFAMLTPADNFGFVLDDVRLEFVPEPSTALLASLGLITLGVSPFRRRN